MTKNNHNIFTSYYPHLDLHGETTDTCVAPLSEFISDNIRLNRTNVVVIHGIGSGILRSRVHELLKNDKRIKTFYLDAWNVGETVITLKIDK